MIIWLIVTFGVWVYGRKDRPKDGSCFFLCFEALTQNLELKPSLFQLILGPMYMVHISTFIHVKSSHPTANLEPCDISGIINPTMTRNLGPVWFNGSKQFNAAMPWGGTISILNTPWVFLWRHSRNQHYLSLFTTCNLVFRLNCMKKKCKGLHWYVCDASGTGQKMKYIPGSPHLGFQNIPKD